MAHSLPHIFLPVAVETAGTWNQSAIELIQESGSRITAVTEDTGETVFLFQRLSIALQRGNAVAFLATFDAVWYPVVVVVFAELRWRHLSLRGWQATLHYKIIISVDNDRQIYKPQPISSELSSQSLTPSQSLSALIHPWVAHLNWPK